MNASATTSVRIDKWLWAARFYKTRGLAVEAIDAGHVRIVHAETSAAERVKPAHAVRIGEHYVVQRGDVAQGVVVLALSDRRGSASDASLLYRETPESLHRRHEMATLRAAAGPQTLLRGRPTKLDRRRLVQFFDEYHATRDDQDSHR
ncbi:MAG: RNA-binding S4 domain-containing protein [Burkholderiales bacterium]|nr:RNA-binding S4 domain-containing protein [Burkholderiales bacterium]